MALWVFEEDPPLIGIERRVDALYFLWNEGLA